MSVHSKRKRKQKNEVAIEVSASRSLTFSLGVPYWDQLLKVCEAILNHRNDGVPDNADVTFHGDSICVDWEVRG